MHSENANGYQGYFPKKLSRILQQAMSIANKDEAAEDDANVRNCCHGVHSEVAGDVVLA